MARPAAVSCLVACLSPVARAGVCDPCTASGPCAACKACANTARDAACAGCPGGSCAWCWASHPELPNDGQPCLGGRRQFCCRCWDLTRPGTCKVVVPPPAPPAPAPPAPTPPAPTPPAPPPAPTPPAPPATYSCQNGRCDASPGGVTKDVCLAACTPPPGPPPGPPPRPPPGPSPPAPGSLGCSGITSVSLTATWAAVRGADTYDIQYLAGASWGTPDEYTSQTSASPSAVIVDLRPATQYTLRVRSHKAGTMTWGWGSFSAASFTCTTAPSPAGQPRALRRVGGLRNSSFSVEWDPAPGAAPRPTRVAAWDAGDAAAGGWGAPPLADAPAAAAAAAAGASSAELTGLLPGRVYWVRAGGGDPVPFRTAAAGTRVWEAVRVSTRTTEIDFLTEHNSGDIPADAGFLTFESGSAIGKEWIGNFKNIVMTRYCVTSADVAWADYLSCDSGLSAAVPAKCGCRCIADAQFAHDRCTPDPLKPAGPNGPVCLCSAASTSNSKKHIGRQPILLPFGGIVPGAGDTLLGYWFSHPHAGECAEGAAVGTGGCTWARHPVAAAAKGSLLLQNGFKKSPTSDVTKAAAFRNRDATKKTFDAHPYNRCCGC